MHDILEQLYIVIYDFIMNMVSDLIPKQGCSTSMWLRQSPSCWSGQVLLRISDHWFMVTHRLISRAGRQQIVVKRWEVHVGHEVWDRKRKRIRTNSYGSQAFGFIFSELWVRDIGLT